MFHWGKPEQGGVAELQGQRGLARGWGGGWGAGKGLEVSLQQVSKLACYYFLDADRRQETHPTASQQQEHGAGYPAPWGGLSRDACTCCTPGEEQGSWGAGVVVLPLL